MAQSVTHLTLDFSSGHDLIVRDLTVCEVEPRIQLCADSAEPAWDSLSPILFAPLLCVWALSLSLSINKST